MSASTFAKELAEKCADIHKDQNGTAFIHLRNKHGSAILSVSPLSVHCPDGLALQFIRDDLAGLIDEGRRLGWKEAVDMMSAIVDQKIDDAKLLEQDEERLRKELAEVVERKADHMVHVDAILQALARVRLVAPKEAP